MTMAPTPAPTPYRPDHDGLDGNDSGGLTIPLSLMFGSIFLTFSGLCCCYYRDKICGTDNNEPLLG